MKKSIGINFVFNLIKTLMSVIFPIITFPYASRVLGVDNIGKVQYCNSIISYFVLISSLGISIYAVREGSKYRDNLKKLSIFSKEILIINTISMFFAYGLFLIYILFFFKNSYYILLIISSMSIVFSTYSIDWLYQIEEDFAYVSIRSFIMQIISLILLFTFVRDKEDFIFYALINIIATSGNAIFNIIHARKYINMFIKSELDLKRHIKPILSIFCISISSSIYMNLDMVMLGSMKGTIEVGLYTAAVKIIQVVKTLVGSFSNVVFPRLSNYLGNSEKKKYENLLFKGLNIILLISIPAGVGMYMLSKQIILLFSGEQFIAANIAAKILAINIIFSIIDGAIYNQVLLPHRKENYATLCTFIGAITNLILNLLLIPLYSCNGAALATLVSEMIVFVGLYYFSSKVINLKSMVFMIFKYILASIAIILWCLFMQLYNLNNLILLTASISGSIIIYFIILFLSKDSVLISLVKSIKIRNKIQ